jgi:hypothetical protein
MPDATKVVAFPNRKKLHLVWDSSAVEDASGVRQTPDTDDRQAELTSVPQQRADPAKPQPEEAD